MCTPLTQQRVASCQANRSAPHSHAPGGCLQWEGQEVELVDTAGWIRRTKLSAYDESGG